MFDKYTTKDSTYKTRISDKLITAFVKSRYVDFANLTRLIGGEVSEAFSFDGADGGYIIRISRHGTDGFEKDKYAYLHFAGEKIPIPKLVEIGEIDQTYSFTLSKRIDGFTVKGFVEKLEKERKVNQMQIDIFALLTLETLDAVHAIDISNTTGFGQWAKDGMANKPTWREFIMNIGKEGWWAGMFKNTFLEEGVYTNLFQRLEQLIEFCPEERYLIHGDFGFDNLLTDGKKVTGIIDWSESKYGDFLYDVAWLSFWPSSYNFKKLCDEYYQKKVFVNYKQRILCYQIHIALNALSFYAKSMQKEKYEWTKQRIEDLLHLGL